MTDLQSNRKSALEIFAVLALVITFLLRYAPFLASHLLFGPFLDNVHVYGPIFSEVSRLALSGAVPYYLPDIGTGFPVFESPHFSILYPFYFFVLINYGGTTGIPLHANQSDAAPHLHLLHQSLCLIAMRYDHTMGLIHRGIGWHAGPEHRALRKLDHDHSQLCMATVSARRGCTVVAISRKRGRAFSCFPLQLAF
jgi:hypothetical protein